MTGVEPLMHSGGPKEYDYTFVCHLDNGSRATDCEVTVTDNSGMSINSNENVVCE